jgi:hypothetical protein
MQFTTPIPDQRYNFSIGPNILVMIYGVILVF